MKRRELVGKPRQPFLERGTLKSETTGMREAENAQQDVVALHACGGDVRDVILSHGLHDAGLRGPLHERSPLGKVEVRRPSGLRGPDGGRERVAIGAPAPEDRLFSASDISEIGEQLGEQRLIVLYLLRLEGDPHVATESFGSYADVVVSGGKVGIDAGQPRVRGAQRVPRAPRLAESPTGRDEGSTGKTDGRDKQHGDGSTMKNARGSDRRAKAVVDVDDSHSSSTTVQHREPVSYTHLRAHETRHDL